MPGKNNATLVQAKTRGSFPSVSLGRWASLDYVTLNGMILTGIDAAGIHKRPDVRERSPSRLAHDRDSPAFFLADNWFGMNMLCGVVERYRCCRERKLVRGLDVVAICVSTGETVTFFQR